MEIQLKEFNHAGKGYSADRSSTETEEGNAILDKKMPAVYRDIDMESNFSRPRLVTIGEAPIVVMAKLMPGYRAVLFTSKLNILMLLTPFAILSKVYNTSLSDINNDGISEVPESAGITFLLSLLALVPFAERLGYITEQLALYTNETVGGFLNATFGNITELMISMFALIKGKQDESSTKDNVFRHLVQVSLLGSVFSNLLLVLGSALFLGGIRYRIQVFNKFVNGTYFAMLMLSTLSLALPTLLMLSPENTENDVLTLSRVISIFMICIYILFLRFQLVTHHDAFEQLAADFSGGIKSLGTRTPSPTAKKPDDGLFAEKFYSQISTKFRSRADDKHNLIDSGNTDVLSEFSAEENEETPEISFFNCLLWLSIITIFVSLLSGFLIDAIEGTVKRFNISELFIGSIVIPIVGNAAEHASALVFASRNKVNIAMAVALGSAVQIAVMALPFCVLVGWVIGTPLSLNIGDYEVIALFLSIVLVSFATSDGISHYLIGAVMMAAYAIIAAGYFIQQSKL